MKFSVTKEHLNTVLKRAMCAISPRVTFPVLNNFLLEASGDRLIVTASDLEISVRTSVPALVEEEGKTTLPAKKLSQIAAAFPAGDVYFVCDEDEISSLSCQKSHYKLRGLDASQFPPLGDFEEVWSFTLPTHELVRNIAKVSYARSSDETRKQLNGVLFSVRNAVLTIAATDGRRLALVEKPLPDPTATDGDVILPNKASAELARGLDGDGDVKVRLNQACVVFETIDTVIMTKLVEGTYPNFRQVIPDNFNRSVAIPRAIFAEALNRVSMVVSDNSASVRLQLNEGQLVVSASSADVGEASEPVDVSYEGDSVTISFNPLFFNEPLKYLDCDQLIMQFKDDYSPVVISGDEGFLYVLMPMRG